MLIVRDCCCEFNINTKHFESLEHETLQLLNSEISVLAQGVVAERLGTVATAFTKLAVHLQSTALPTATKEKEGGADVDVLEVGAGGPVAFQLRLEGEQEGLWGAVEELLTFREVLLEKGAE